MRLPLLLSALTLCLSAQEPTPLKAPLAKVRLHPDEAWITRLGRAHVEGAGVHRLQIGELPSGLRLEDLQVSAKGPAGTRLGDVAVRADVRAVTETEAWRKLEAEREQLRDRRDALEATRDSVQNEIAFLKALQATHAKELGGRLTYALPSAQGVADFGRGVQQRLAALVLEERKALRGLERLAKEEKRVDAEMAQRQGEQRTAPSLVTVELATAGPGAVEVELTYRQTQARWRPTYEARLSEDRKTLALALYAAVTQKTGESWEGVKVEISNARPSRGLEYSVYDGPQMVAVEKGVLGGVPGGIVGGVVGGVAQVNAYSLDRNRPAPKPEPPSAAVVEVVASQDDAEMIDEASGLAATWALEGLKDIPSDGQPHRFRVQGREVKPTLALLAIPRLEPNVQQVARFEAPGQFPLFPSASVTHFVGAQRLGESHLALPGPKQPFELGFGPFKPLRVAVRKLDRKEEQVGTFSKERQWTIREALEVANDGGEAVELEVQDRALKSDQESVKVVTLPETTAGWEEREPGVRTWKVKVGPKGTAAVSLSTQVRAPLEGRVSGLE